MILLPLILAAGADAALLGHDGYRVREAAESRLRAAGPLAWPALLAAAGSGDPEIRHRADRLLVARRRLLLEARAWAVLAGPFPPDAVEFYCDHDLREWTHHAAVRAGCPVGAAWPIHPRAYDDWGGWWASCMPHVRCLGAVLACREHLNLADPGWPLRRPRPAKVGVATANETDEGN